MNWIQTTLALLQLAPSLLQLIVNVESLFPHKAGPAKKAIVLAAVTDAQPEAAAAAGKFIDASVASFNAAGVFPAVAAADPHRISA